MGNKKHLFPPIAVLCRALSSRSWRGSESLDIRLNSAIGDGGMKEVMEALVPLQRLRSLQLPFTGMGEEAGKVLLRAIETK